jgi:hypothetical protein
VLADPHETARIVGKYTKAQRPQQHLHVGDGRYGIVAVYGEGTRILNFVGFESADDAELFAAFVRGQLDIEEPAPQPFQPRTLQDLFSLHAGEQRPPGKVVAFEIVTLTAAVPTQALAMLRNGLL